MKEVYQVYTSVNGETVKKFETASLSEAGFYQGKLIAAGVSSWLQIARTDDLWYHPDTFDKAMRRRIENGETID